MDGLFCRHASTGFAKPRFLARSFRALNGNSRADYMMATMFDVTCSDRVAGRPDQRVRPPRPTDLPVLRAARERGLCWLALHNWSEWGIVATSRKGLPIDGRVCFRCGTKRLVSRTP
jgi:hypothetical protein